MVLDCFKVFTAAREKHLFLENPALFNFDTDSSMLFVPGSGLDATKMKFVLNCSPMQLSPYMDL